MTELSLHFFEVFYDNLYDIYLKVEFNDVLPEVCRGLKSPSLWTALKEGEEKPAAVGLFSGSRTSDPLYFHLQLQACRKHSKTKVDSLALFNALTYININIKFLETNNIDKWERLRWPQQLTHLKNAFSEVHVDIIPESDFDSLDIGSEDKDSEILKPNLSISEDVLFSLIEEIKTLRKEIEPLIAKLSSVDKSLNTYESRTSISHHAEIPKAVNFTWSLSDGKFVVSSKVYTAFYVILIDEIFRREIGREFQENIPSHKIWDIVLKDGRNIFQNEFPSLKVLSKSYFYRKFLDAKRGSIKIRVDIFAFYKGLEYLGVYQSEDNNEWNKLSISQKLPTMIKAFQEKYLLGLDSQAGASVIEV